MPKLRAALTIYLKVERAPLTNRQYGLILGRMVAELGPGRAVGRVSYEELLDYLDGLGVRLSTRRSYVSIIKAFFAWCVEMGYAEQSPAARLRRGPRHAQPPLPRAIPPEELTRIVEYVRYASPRNFALLLFMADTGCRVSGLCSLSLDNLHIEEGYAWLLEKGSRFELALFGVDTAAALRRWLGKRPDVNHRYVWTSRGPHYQPLTPNGVRYILAALSRRTECSRVWFPHAIRHAVAYAWANAGVPATLVAQKLWHTDVRVTLENYYPRAQDALRMTQQRLALAALKPTDQSWFGPVPLPKIQAPPEKQRKLD